MSVNYNRAHTKKCVTRKVYLRKQVNMDYPPYWDEGIRWHPKKTSPKSAWRCKRQLRSYQMRMYKTWKHNRKTQWKDD